VSRRQKHLTATITANPTTTGLHLLGDSTGIKMSGEREWKTKKHGADYRRQWGEVHLGIDTTTLEIQAIEVTDNATGDAQMLRCLLDQIGAYDTKAHHEAICRTWRTGHYSDAQKRQTLERPPTGG